MNLSFALTEDDVLNATIRDSVTNSIMYTVETPKYTGDAFTTTVTRRNQIDGSTRFAFRIVWERMSLEDARVVLDRNLLEEVPARQVLESSSGNTTYGSVYIHGVEYKWKCKGIGSKLVLVDQETKQTVAQSHGRVRGNFFRKPRDMSLEITHQISPAVDIVLLTFLLAWMESKHQKLQGETDIWATSAEVTLSPLPMED